MKYREIKAWGVKKRKLEYGFAYDVYMPTFKTKQLAENWLYKFAPIGSESVVVKVIIKIPIK